jgi:hypothetical protein
MQVELFSLHLLIATLRNDAGLQYFMIHLICDRVARRDSSSTSA